MDKAAQIDQVVDDVIRRHQSGVPYSFSEVTQKHPDLMPDLGQRLETLQAIAAAAEHAREQPASSGIPSATHWPLGDEVDLLREALPGYEFAEPLRRGGQGIVFRAVQLSTNREVAIKVLLDGPVVSDRQRHRFAREVALVARLRHPNIVTVYDSGVVCGRPYFAMEYVDGLSIDDYLLLHRPSVRERVRVFIKVCQAVSFAHQHGIIHRDLKPPNVLVDPEGEPHVLDFGLAKDYVGDLDSVESATISVSGQVVGTLPYLSPEQARGADQEVEVRSDVYTLGVMLYEMLTGTFPYPVGGEPLTVRNNIVMRDPVPPRRRTGGDKLDGCVGRAEISDDLEAIVLKALEKDKSHRYQSTAALAEDLLRYLAGEAVEAKAASTLYVLKKTVRKFRKQVAAAGVLLLLLIGFSISMGVLWRRAEDQRLRAEEQARIFRTGLDMGGLLKTGSVARDEGRLDEAIAMFEKAIELGNGVVTTEPAVLRYYYGAHHRLAELHSLRKDHDKADPHCSAAVKLASDLVAADPENLEWRRLFAFSSVLQGNLAKARKRWEDALASFAQAAHTLDEVAELATDPGTITAELALALDMQGTCCAALERFDEALACQNRAYELRQELHAAQPDAIDPVLTLARSENNFAFTHLRHGTPEHDQMAAEWLARAEHRIEKLRSSARAESRSWGIQQVMDDIRGNQAVVEYRASHRAGKID